MRTFDCAHCGDSVVVPDDGETVTNGETGIEHMERTGHNWKREARLTACHECGFSWWFTGTEDYATCPGCEATCDAGTIPDDVDEACARADKKSARSPFPLTV